MVGDMEGVFCYLDDLLVYSKSEQEHVQTLEELFSRLSKAGLTLALSKCVFGVDTVEYLGYSISQSGLSPIKKKIDAFEKFPAPTKQKELLAFWVL